MNDQQAGSQERSVPCWVKGVLRGPYTAVRWLYHYMFARPSMQPVNDRILDLALHARGYNNCCELRTTGEELFLNVLARHRPKLCIDIGANIGTYAARLLELTEAKVIAFEPLPKAYERLRAIKARYGERFEAINKGVGDKHAHLQLHYGTEDSEYASFSSEVNQIDYVGNHNINVMTVEVITLDGFLEEGALRGYGGVDLLKIDTEGFEYEVLVGARQTIATMRPKFVQIEYNWHQLFRTHSLLKLAEHLPGYKAYQLLPYGTGLAYRDTRSPETNIYHYSNFVFVRGDVALSV